MLLRGFFIVLVLFVSGCGGDDSDGADEASEASPNAAAGEDADDGGSDDGDSGGGGAGGGSHGETIDLTGVDACSFLDEATVQSLTGESESFVTDDREGACFWAVPRPGFGAYVELEVRESSQLTPQQFAQQCSVAPSSAVGEEADFASCPGSDTAQAKMQLRALERGVLVRLLVNDPNKPVTEAELAHVVSSVVSQLG